MIRKVIIQAIFVCIILGYSPFVWSANRGEIKSNETKYGYEISNSSYTDTWTFQGEVGDRVIITAVATSGSLNTEIYLYSPSGSLEVDTYPFGDNLDHQLLETGQYTVIVQDYLLDETGYYNITFLKIPGDVTSADDLDGGPIYSGETLSGNIITSDLDAFQFEGEAGDRVIITAVSTSGSLNTELYLYPPDSGPLEAETNPFGDKLDHQLLETGQYTVIVQDYLLDDTGYYNITLLKIPGDVASADDLDGGPIYSGETLSGNIIISDLDAFQFEGEAGDRVIITAVSTSGSLNTELYLYPPDSGPLEAETNPFGDKLDHQLLETGQYTVIVQDYLLDDTGYYNITFLKIPGDVTSADDLDGGPIYSGETLSGNILTSDLDAFQFEGEAGDRVIITAVSTSGSLNTELYLYPPDSGPLEAETNPFGDKLDHQLLETGQYTVIVQDYLLDDTGYYNITLLKIPGDVTSADDSDGGPITTCNTLSGRIIASDLDAFQFEGEAGDHVIITAVSTSGSLNTELYLYPPDGGPLEADTNPFGDSLDHQLLQTGLYTVVVQDYLLDSTGYYNISLSSTDIDSPCPSQSQFPWSLFIPIIINNGSAGK